MLIKRVVLDQIVAGEIDLIFRRWRKPTVKTGGQLRTSVGMLDIIAVDKITKASLRAADAKRAGATSKAALLEQLDDRSVGRSVGRGPPDPCDSSTNVRAFEHWISQHRSIWNWRPSKTMCASSRSSASPSASPPDTTSVRAVAPTSPPRLGHRVSRVEAMALRDKLATGHLGRCGA